MSHVLPGCVWDWSHPTPWLLQREISGADWCLVARRLAHLGKGRQCCRGIWSCVTRMLQERQRESIHVSITTKCHRITNFLWKHQVFNTLLQIIYCSMQTDWVELKGHKCIIYFSELTINVIMVYSSGSWGYPLLPLLNHFLTGNYHNSTAVRPDYLQSHWTSYRHKTCSCNNLLSFIHSLMAKYQWFDITLHLFSTYGYIFSAAHIFNVLFLKKQNSQQELQLQ